MTRHIVLLRGINLGPRNRIAMPVLRDALAEAGFEDVSTYLQSGNVVLSGGTSAAAVAKSVERVIESSFGLDIPVVVRTRAQLAKVVALDPLGDVVTNPKRYQVSFLSAKPNAEAMRKAEAAAAPAERVVFAGREIYAWHPGGVGPSKLWALLASPRIGATATARNWTTVTTLLEMADE